MSLMPEGTSNLMLLVGIALLILIMLRRSYRYFGPRRNSSAGLVDPGEQDFLPRSARRARADAPEEVLQWQVELHELARDIKGELDTKMRLLQLLVDQARIEAERLQGLLAQVAVQRSATDCRDEHPRPPGSE